MVINPLAPSGVALTTIVAFFPLSQVLGLKSDASMAEIKKAHRKLALQNHPDKGGSDDKFREIQEAFETLQKVHGAKSKRPKFRESTK